MAKAKKTTYIVGYCESEGDGITLSKVVATEGQIKKYIAERITQLKSDYLDEFEYGTTCAKDIEVNPYGRGYIEGHAVFNNWHVDISAVPEMEAEVITP